VTAEDDRIAYLGGDEDVALGADDRADLDALRDLLGDPALWEEPDPALEDRVVAAIAAEAAAGREPSPVVPQPPGRRRSRRPRTMVWGGLAVAAAVAILLGLLLAVRSTSPAGEHFSLALAPTELAPGAQGKADMTKTSSGWRIELDATGLPRLDGGRYYQAWLKDDAGMLVPIGTFNEGTDVTLWAGVSPRDFRTLTITQEQADGEQASSGRRVLVGTLDLG